MLTVGAKTYAFLPGIGSTGQTELAEVTIANGTTIVDVARRPDARKFSAFVRNHWVITNTSVSPLLPLTPPPYECAADAKNRNLYLESNNGSTQSNIINVVNVSPSAVMSFVTTFPTDATTGFSYSGGSFDISGIVFDPTDKAVIISTSNGYELYDAASPYHKITTKGIAGKPAENFGYNPVTNQIWSPIYSVAAPNLQLGDLKTGKLFSISPLPASILDPDSGSVDTGTNIAIAPEEGPGTLDLVALKGATFSGSTFSAPEVTFNLSVSTVSPYIPASAIDSAAHIAFLSGEFGSTDLCVVQLPLTGTGTPTPTDYACATFPNTPDSNPFSSPFDPHATSTFDLSKTQHYGLMFNAQDTYVGIIDLVKFLAAPRDPTDPHAVKTGYDFIGNKVIFYVQI